MKITVVGLGYVGMANAVLLAQNHEVKALDIDEERVELVNRLESPVADTRIGSWLRGKRVMLEATTSKRKAYQNTDYVLVATPTDYNPEINHFDTTAVESVARDAAEMAPGARIVIKSTVPIGYTDGLKRKLGKDDILFSPEFLREGRALEDNLYPSRIVVGGDKKAAFEFAQLMAEGAAVKDVPIVCTGTKEAEAVKLFANAYLAMRVSFFNELDTLAEVSGMSTRDIVEGVCLDPRVGMHYNNPSFGYGGYCLPKDSKQLLAHYEGVPQRIVQAIVASNERRKQHIAEMVLKKKPKTVGVYRLQMKTGSDNFRHAAIRDVIRHLASANVEVLIYEPSLQKETFEGFDVIANLEKFKHCSDIILANRTDDELQDVAEKVYTKDLFRRD